MTHSDPWTISLEAPPLDSDPHALLRFALNVALTAPSPGNSQPWRFLLGDEHVDIFTDPGRALPVRDPEGQQRIIAGGAALGLLRVALRALGLGETTTLLPGDHPDLLARVALSGSVIATPEETWLLQAAPKRRTHRGLLAARPVRERLLQRLQDVARDSDAELLVLGSSRQRAALAARVDAAAQQHADQRLAGAQPRERVVAGGGEQGEHGRTLEDRRTAGGAAAAVLEGLRAGLGPGAALVVPRGVLVACCCAAASTTSMPRS